MNLPTNQPPFDPRTEQPPSPAPPRAGVIDRPSSPTASPSPTPPRLAAERAGDSPYQDVLFHGLDAEQFKSQWHEIQGAFVDAPQQAVKQADELVRSVIEKLESEFSIARTNLEQAWTKDAEPSTEDLRKALQRYRGFFNRLLSV